MQVFSSSPHPLGAHTLRSVLRHMLFLESNVVIRKPLWRKLGHKITLLLTNDLRHVLVKFARSKQHVERVHAAQISFRAFHYV